MDTDLQKEIISFLTSVPQFKEENGRKAMLSVSEIDVVSLNLDLRGSPQEFVTRLIQFLDSLPDGISMLIRLLGQIELQVKLPERDMLQLLCSRLMEDKQQVPQEEPLLVSDTNETETVVHKSIGNVFICHVSEDSAVVKRLAKVLNKEGLDVFYDTFELTIEDNLSRVIDRGLAKFPYGIVILSPHFFKRHYSQEELARLVAWETPSERLILPIWHRMTKEDVLKFSPGLTNMERNVVVPIDEEIEVIVPQILRRASEIEQEFTFKILSINTRRKVKEQDQRAYQYIEYLGARTKLEMVAIPGGTFQMGSPKSEKDSKDNERPRHPVSVAPFYMSKYQVTQEQWKTVAESVPAINRQLDPNPSNFEREAADGRYRPVEQITWDDAVEFCERLSKLTGRHYRLPTEAEWEYACRAGTETPFHFGKRITPCWANYKEKDGDDYKDKDSFKLTKARLANLRAEIPEIVDFKNLQDKEFLGKNTFWEAVLALAENEKEIKEIKRRTNKRRILDHARGIFRRGTIKVTSSSCSPNAFGLYGMHGNVWEWCLDHWHDNYKGAPTDGKAWKEDKDPEFRVLRGGSWSDPQDQLRAACRETGLRNESSPKWGFRLVYSPIIPDNGNDEPERIYHRKERRIDAAVPSSVGVGEPIELLVQVCSPDSPQIDVNDWPTHQKPSYIEQRSESISIYFPENQETHKPDSGKIWLQVDTPPGFPVSSKIQRDINIPAKTDSKPISFRLIPEQKTKGQITVRVYNPVPINPETDSLDTTIDDESSSGIITLPLPIIVKRKKKEKKKEKKKARREEPPRDEENEDDGSHPTADDTNGTPQEQEDTNENGDTQPDKGKTTKSASERTKETQSKGTQSISKATTKDKDKTPKSALDKAKETKPKKEQSIPEATTYSKEEHSEDDDDFPIIDDLNVFPINISVVIPPDQRGEFPEGGQNPPNDAQLPDKQSTPLKTSDSSQPQTQPNEQEISPPEKRSQDYSVEEPTSTHPDDPPPSETTSQARQVEEPTPTHPDDPQSQRIISVAGDYFEHIEGNVYKGTDNNSLPSLNDPKPLQEAYLNQLFETYGRVFLININSQESMARLNLGVIYTTLLTRNAKHLEFYQTKQQEQQTPQLSALAQLNHHKRLVLLGNPGSGKSTFVNFMTMALAKKCLTAPHTNQGLLQVPLPDNEQHRNEEELQPWEHGALLPMRITLRDFAARGLSFASQATNVEHLWTFMRKELEETDLEQYIPHLKEHLREEGGLILFDGLDEVPEANQRRTQIKQVIEGFAETFDKCRILVTSRTYAYQQQEWRLSGFAEAVLAPFTEEQICKFADRWYQHSTKIRGEDNTNAIEQAGLLKQAILTSDRLYSLAQCPLLLTLMASLHYWRGVSLPKNREELYNDTVELFLDWWEQLKIDRNRDGGSIFTQKNLLVKKTILRKFLESLAFQAHRDQVDLAGTAEMTEDKLESELRNKNLHLSHPIEYLKNRAGLLVSRGNRMYTFPNRTFQEYLAACYLVGQEKYPDNIAKLARQDPDRWREVLLLAGAEALHRAKKSIWELAEALCYQECTASVSLAPGKSTPDPSQADSGLTEKHPPGPPPFDGTQDRQGGNEDAWGALLAGQTLTETADLQKVSPRNRSKVERIQKWLVAILTEQVPAGDPFPVVERALAGNILAQLGDPRPGVGVQNNNVADIEWCEVPAGPFLMGSDLEKDKDAYEDERPQHEVHLSTFAISRYPVTNAQYRLFIGAGGYTESCQQHWTPEGWEWKKRENIDGSESYGGAFDLANHPVVGVSWYEASAFCQWLTCYLRENGELTTDQEIRLPTEAEWEKAARGTEGRIYPWGDEIDSEHANHNASGLGVTGTVGCFPRGISPYGCEDLSGNVYEWCLDWFDSVYYADSPTKKPSGSVSGLFRVFRGGNWYSNARCSRVAYRDGRPPAYRDSTLGFRLLRTAL